MTNKTHSWAEWLAELQRLGVKFNYSIGDGEVWRNYYEDGYTPSDALAEDLSYA